MWTAMISAMTSSKLAVGGLAATLLIGGGAAVDSTGIGAEIRQSVGLSAQSASESDDSAVATVDASGSGEAGLTVEPRSIEANVEANADAETDAIEVNTETHAHVAGSSDASVGLTGALGASAETHASSDQVEVGGSGAIGATVGIQNQTDGTSAEANVDVVVGIDVDPSETYNALVERARAVLAPLSGQACTDATVTAAVEAIGPADVSLAEQAVVDVCAELGLDGALDAVPHSPTLGGTIVGTIGAGLSLD